MQETENRADTLGSRVARLIDVKSIVTLALVGVMCIMTVTEKETGELFNSCIMLVLGFFFGKNLNGGGGGDKAKQE